MMNSAGISSKRNGVFYGAQFDPVRSTVPPALRVGVVLLPHFTLTPFAGFVDVLRLAADEDDRSRQIRCSWTVMTSNGRSARSSSGVEITQVRPLLDPCQFDYIVVFGGVLHNGTHVDSRLIEYLQLADRCHVTLVGICTGVLALIKGGLMQRKKCCVSWFHYREIVSEFPTVLPVSDQIFVVDGKRITCAGGGGAIDLAAWLVDRHIGSAAALKSLHILLIDRARPADSAQPQSPAVSHVRDRRVQRAVLVIEQSIESPLTLSQLASRVGVSARQLHRLFVRELGLGPTVFARKYRLRHGMRLLRGSDLRVADIAVECGFSDMSHFHKSFLAEYGVRPSEFRRQVRQVGIVTAPTSATTADAVAELPAH